MLNKTINNLKKNGLIVKLVKINNQKKYLITIFFLDIVDQLVTKIE